MKINPLNLRPIDSARIDKKAKPKEGVNNSSIKEATLCETLKQAREKLANMPEIDTERVACIKAAIADGKMDVCLDTLAESLQQFYKG
ncbi:flagellar biosynthesis anti-sigma factor FlgM [Serratia sp. M24T3]|uniref:flagellar biosynthesis anti-sigma factor FlgM n=1 Tax=Serratia sp. M24T3 TaxID=932213 RepID=UPI00025BBCA2|nr:flagellar biosynthesis anti-sigma factor FlgM [Serratia sp. M24T3]EIC82581.1 hypothetical protein SPM24T3_21059 [Serratia sp. M24T3]